MTRWFAPHTGWMDTPGKHLPDAFSWCWFGLFNYDLDRMGLPSVWFEAGL